MDSLAVYDLLPEHVWSKATDANTRLFWKGFADQLTELKGVFADIAALRSIDDQEGTQLDLTGVLLNEPREGKSDTDYRLFLKAAVFRQNSNGSTYTLSQISVLILGSKFRGIRNMWPRWKLLDGTGTLDGTGKLDAVEDFREGEDDLYLDGSFVLDGTYPLWGGKHQPQCIQCRYANATTASEEATYQRIMQLAAGSGCLVIFQKETT